MDAAMGREADALALLTELAEAPHRHDFYQTMRRLECLFEDKPRWGHAKKITEEPVRLGQEADLAFASSALASCDPGTAGRRPRIQFRHFGLLGPNGPLPIHFTEYVRERIRSARDPALSRFLDLFHHRFLTFFYRAWAQAQPHVNHDRPEDDRFRTYVGALFGLSGESFRNRDAVPDLSKWFHAGVFVRQVRNADGLAAVLREFFRVPVTIQQFVGHWMAIEVRERSTLGRGNSSLGTTVTLGGRVWDRQHKFRIRIGPMSQFEYESFLPAGDTRLQQLLAWVRLYTSLEHAWDVQLVLRRPEVPALALGGGSRLGWTAWLGKRQAGTDADDLCLNAEALSMREGRIN